MSEALTDAQIEILTHFEGITGRTDWDLNVATLASVNWDLNDAIAMSLGAEEPAVPSAAAQQSVASAASVERPSFEDALRFVSSYSQLREDARDPAVLRHGSRPTSAGRSAARQGPIVIDDEEAGEDSEFRSLGSVDDDDNTNDIEMDFGLEDQLSSVRPAGPRATAGSRQGAADYIGGGAAESDEVRIVSPFGVQSERPRAAQAVSPELSRLERMFAPPVDIMFMGSLRRARDLCKQKQRWLLVNIQAEGVFQCSELNRDVWSRDDVKAAIREHFIFLQLPSYTAEAREYANFYPFGASFPHIAILEPRTGERVRSWNAKPSDAAEFICELREFVDAHSLTGKSLRKQPLPPAAASSGGGGGTPRLVDMSEEDQLAAVLAASLGHGDEKEKEKEKRKRESEERRSASPAAKPRSESPEDSYASPWLSVALEPEDAVPAALGTTLQIRFPTGERLKRRFRADAPVAQIFAFLVQARQELQTKPFDVQFMRKRLSEHAQLTLRDADVLGASLTVTFDEESG